MIRRTCVTFVLLLLAAPSLAAAPPELDHWLLNTSGQTGYGGLPANVQRIRYSAANGYVNCSGIPRYTIGPWPGDPNVPSNQSFLFRIPRNPVANAGTKTATPLGPVGAWINGVPVFNSLDAMSYMGQNVWHQNAVVVEASSFDACLGHPAPGGVYHHHQNPTCLYTADSTQHSPILGYAWDGFPIYGPYGYRNADGSGGFIRNRSSYAKRNITQRTTLPDGTALPPSQYGPAVSSTYPLGYYAEDFEYLAGSGELDAYNGREVVTPEYPAGIYAYFVTLDETGASAYPYVIGPRYYGVVANDDISTHGHVTISESVTDYTPSWLGVDDLAPGVLQLSQNAPNPFQSTTTIDFRTGAAARVTIRLFDLAGRQVMTLLSENRPAGRHSVVVDGSKLRTGLYYYQLSVGGQVRYRKLLLLR